jgi:hypothetical protein
LTNLVLLQPNPIAFMKTIKESYDNAVYLAFEEGAALFSTVKNQKDG